MTPDKRVEEKVNLLKRYIREAYPQGDKILDLVDEILTEYHQDISTALVEALEEIKHRNLSLMETGSEFMTPRMYRALAHNQALTEAQTIIRTLLESKN